MKESKLKRKKENRGQFKVSNLLPGLQLLQRVSIQSHFSREVRNGGLRAGGV